MLLFIIKTGKSSFQLLQTTSFTGYLKLVNNAALLGSYACALFRSIEYPQCGDFGSFYDAMSLFISSWFLLQMPTFLRDVSFYLVAICWLIGMLSDGRISRFEALGYVILYIVYVSSVILMLKVSQHLEKRRVSFANSKLIYR